MDSAMKKALAVFEKSGKTLEELGNGMGYSGEVARKSAWQFLNRTADPRLSMLRKFCKAMGVPLQEMVAESEPEKPEKKRISRK